MKLKRYAGNPILAPHPDHFWEDLAVFNPAAWYDAEAKQVLLLCRAAESHPELDSGEKFTSDLPYKQPESTKSSGQRELQAQACENMLRTRSAISNNPSAREVIPSTSVGWIFVTKESPSP